MIRVAKIKNEFDKVTGFRCEGHAMYDKYGSDIVCASVSALIFNTMNSIEVLTRDQFSCKQDENNAVIEFIIVSEISKESELLLDSLFLGLQGIQKDYGKKYVTITA